MCKIQSIVTKQLLPVTGAEVWQDGGVPDLGGPLLVLQERLPQVALLPQQPLHVPAVVYPDCCLDFVTTGWPGGFMRLQNGYHFLGEI